MILYTKLFLYYKLVNNNEKFNLKDLYINSLLDNS
jgi:hypothetical protein